MWQSLCILCRPWGGQFPAYFSPVQFPVCRPLVQPILGLSQVFPSFRLVRNKIDGLRQCPALPRRVLLLRWTRNGPSPEGAKEEGASWPKITPYWPVASIFGPQGAINYWDGLKWNAERECLLWEFWLRRKFLVLKKLKIWSRGVNGDWNNCLLARQITREAVGGISRLMGQTKVRGQFI